MRSAIRETSKPIPEKIAMETNGLLSDFSDEADDAGICAEMREAFGMSGSPIHKSKTPTHWHVVWPATTKVQRPAPNSNLRPPDDGTEQHNCDAIFRQIVLIGFRILSRCGKNILPRRGLLSGICADAEGPRGCFRCWSRCHMEKSFPAGAMGNSRRYFTTF